MVSNCDHKADSVTSFCIVLNWVALNPISLNFPVVTLVIDINDFNIFPNEALVKLGHSKNIDIYLLVELTTDDKSYSGTVVKLVQPPAKLVILVTLDVSKLGSAVILRQAKNVLSKFVALDVSIPAGIEVRA